jgi:hypothetical protein
MAAALVATALVHLPMLGTMQPLMFFGWVVALVTTIAVVFPFWVSPGELEWSGRGGVLGGVGAGGWCFGREQLDRESWEEGG